MPFEANQPLLHYRLIKKIGEGGMGVVWQARDTNLDRDVAIKILPEGIGAEPDRLARFEREAKILAALDHPNIASVYGLHEADGQRFIAMEFVPGEDLAERLARGPLPVDDALDIGRQVAAGLEAAHEQGVIHRDLKPANIKCTPDGKVKVLDLGLAKALVQETSGGSVSASLSPTITSAGTIAGTLLGTAAYMSPEQAKGKAVDRRADIWAFGVVLHEMLTSRRLFEAETISETLAAVLRDEVSIDGMPAVPTSVTNLLRRCLDRNPGTRLRDIGEARIALSPEALSSAGDATASVTGHVPAPSTPSRLLPWALVVLLAALAAFALWGRSTSPTVETEPIKLVAPIPGDLRVPLVQMGVMALSPDGKTLALALQRDTQPMLYTRTLDGDDFVEMPGTENASSPFFSLDGQWIGFFADDKLKKVPVGGGTPMTLCDSQGANRGATWGSDDRIVYSPHYTRPLMRVSSSGGEPEVLTTIDGSKEERTHRWPFAIPGEDLILFTVGTVDSPEDYDGARIEVLNTSTGKRSLVLERASMAWYVPTGHLVFGRGGFLFAVRFDLDTLETRGEPVPVVENVLGVVGAGVVHAGFANNGLLAFIPGTSGRRASRLVWRDRDGTTEPLNTPLARYGSVKFSPNRERFAVTIFENDSSHIWIYQVEQKTFTRMTFEGRNRLPAWSPDGNLLAFGSARGKALEGIYTKAADGSGQAELKLSPVDLGITSAGTVTPADWTPDGKQLIVEYSDDLLQNVGVYHENTGEFRPLVNTPASEFTPALSPDGRWLAYTSDETGTYQVFVRDLSGSGGKWQVSNKDIGGLPTWAPDGSELFFLSPPDLYSVAVTYGDSGFRSGRPTVVFNDLAANSRVFDVYDSNRFLFVERMAGDSMSQGVTVVVNWFDELERLVPE